MLSSNMLLPNLILPIDVTFSTPTGDYTHLKRASFGLSSTRNPIVRITTDDTGPFTGSTLNPKLPKRRNMNPGIGSGQRSSTIPQISSPIAPSETSAIPIVLRMAGL
jgi:hypothetical protein